MNPGSARNFRVARESVRQRRKARQMVRNKYRHVMRLALRTAVEGRSKHSVVVIPPSLSAELDSQKQYKDNVTNRLSRQPAHNGAARLASNASRVFSGRPALHENAGSDSAGEGIRNDECGGSKRR